MGLFWATCWYSKVTYDFTGPARSLLAWPAFISCGLLSLRLQEVTSCHHDLFSLWPAVTSCRHDLSSRLAITSYCVTSYFHVLRSLHAVTACCRFLPTLLCQPTSFIVFLHSLQYLFMSETPASVLCRGVRNHDSSAVFQSRPSPFPTSLPPYLYMN